MFSWETLHSVAVGGVASHVTELAAALQRHGHHVHVFTRSGYGSGGVCEIEGVWYHHCPFNTHRGFFDETQEMCQSFVWHFFQEEDRFGHFDVIHAHDWLASSAMVRIKQARPDHRAVLTMHSTEYGRCGNHFRPLPGSSGSFSLARIEVQSAEVEEDVGFETLFVPITEGLLDQSLDCIVQTFNGAVGEAMGKEG